MFLLQKGQFLPKDAGVVLLGGQPVSRPEWLNCIEKADFLAAADGGAAMALLLAKKRCPDLLVGDFDSLPAEMLGECQQAGSEICRLPVHKDQTDGEFLLQRLEQEGWRRLLILGALGGRLEQTLANLLVAAPLAKRGVEICFGHDGGLVFLLGAEQQKRQLVLQGFAGCLVSLVALGESCRLVKLEGFAYPLQGELPVYTSLGISNVVEAAKAWIELENGCLLVFINF